MSYDIDEVIPPDVSGLDLGLITALVPTGEEFQSAIWAGGGVVGGLIIAKALEGFLLNTVRVPRFVLPFVHGAAGIMLGKAVSRYSAPLGVGVVGAFGALAIVRALDVFFNVRVNALSGLEGADLSSFADLMGGDELLPPELQGLDAVAIEEHRGMGGVTVEQMGWVHG